MQDSSVGLDLTFALKTRRDTEANVKSTTLVAQRQNRFRWYDPATPLGRLKSSQALRFCRSVNARGEALGVSWRNAVSLSRSKDYAPLSLAGLFRQHAGAPRRR